MCKPITITKSPKLSSLPTPSSKRNHHRQKQAWWQASVARRTASSLEEKKSDDDNDEFDIKSNIMQFAECRFFNEVEEKANILRLHRNQIRINKESPLGVGAFSEVYSVSIAGHNDPQKLVMKHLRSDLLSDRKRFHQAASDLVMETKALSRLDHPNIINIRGYAAEGVSAFNDGSHDSYFILLEEVKMTLSDRIKQWKKMDEEKSKSKKKRPVPHLQEKLRYATQIASALRYLHEHNIIYRDLKPDNIGITADGTVKLLDFGLCRVLPKSHEKSEVFELSGVGTRRYMSPEAVLKRGYNLKADVFGFAMVIFELFAETKPYEFYNRQMHKQFACIEGIRPTIPDCWPKDLIDIVQSAWNGNPSKRPTSTDIYYQLKEFMASSAEADSSSSAVHNDIVRLLRHPFAALLRSKKVGSNKSNDNALDASSTAGSSVSARV